MASKTTEAQLKLRAARKHLKWAVDESHPNVREHFLWETVTDLIDATDLLSQVLEAKIVGEADIE